MFAFNKLFDLSWDKSFLVNPLYSQYKPPNPLMGVYDTLWEGDNLARLGPINMEESS